MFFNQKNNLIFATIAGLLAIIHITIVFTLDPPNLAQGVFGNIFYIHVPVAWTAFLLYFFVMVSGIVYLINQNKI